MNMHSFLGELAVSAVCVLAALVHALLGIRARRWDPSSAFLHFAVASVALVIAAFVLLGVVSPIIGYATLCVALACFTLFDLLQDEHTRRLRVASLAPRPTAEFVPTVWIAISMASVLLLVPYVTLGEQRGAALIVGIGALVMAGIAWRIASAPVQLYGEDIRSERMRDRASRSRKAGVTATVAVGTVFAFISFVNSGLPAVLPLQRLFLTVSFLTWACLGVWVVLYSLYLGRLSSSSS